MIRPTSFTNESPGVNLLAIYTASEPGSAALVARGGSFTRTLRGGRTNEELAPAARELLEEAGLASGDLDGVAAVRGPGSFTGLRLGAATAMGLARGANAPLFAAATLEVWAASAVPLADAAAAGGPAVDAATAGRLVRVVLDARRGEVYAGGLSIRDGIPLPFDGPAAMPPAEALARIEPEAVVVGDGRRLLVEVGMDPDRPGFGQPPEPLALALARLVARDPARHACGAGGLVLDYVRRPQAVEALAAGGAGHGRLG